MSSKLSKEASRDWEMMDLDPVTEVKGNEVVRNFERRMPEFNVTRVVFFRALMVMVECLVPNCKGHEKYGVVEEGNIPVVFRRHLPEKLPTYVMFKNHANRPIRVPETGDKMMVGIKWKATETSMLLETQKALPSIFDCLIADLRLRMLFKEFCLECLFMHSNGKGFLLERFLKTLLYHIVPWGRLTGKKESFMPIRCYDRKMEMKFKRIWWGSKSFKVSTDSRSLKEQCSLGSPEKLMRFSREMFEGYDVDPQAGILRNLDSITRINVLVKCSCFGGKSRICQVYCGLLRRLKVVSGKAPEYNISLARWQNDGEEYEDPIWNYSMFGNDTPTQRLESNLTDPISKQCGKCKSFLNIVDVQVPKTTWLFMADLSETLRKMSVKGLQSIGSYQTGGVVFYPAFVLVYNTKNGQFTSLNLVKRDEWRFFDDLCGGLFKNCDPDKVRYQDKLNVRVFFYRKTEVNPHACLSRVASNI